MTALSDDVYIRIKNACRAEVPAIRTLLNVADTLDGLFNAYGAVQTDLTAAGAIPAYRLVKGHTDGTILVGTLASKRILGCNGASAAVSTGTVTVEAGPVTVTAAEPILAGDLLKCGDNGRVLQLADADNVDTVIGTGTAGNFGNQPADDAVEVLSDDEADTTQEVTIIGTTHGGHTVATETVTLTGTDVVTTTKDDWGLILGVKLSAACAGTVTIREASGNSAITTIAAEATSAGVVEVAAASQGAHGLIPYIKAAAASTKEVGIKYEPATGAEDTYGAAALDGTTAAALPAAANLVKEIYLGDVATSTVATVYTNASEDPWSVKVGRALENITAGSTGKAFIHP